VDLQICCHYRKTDIKTNGETNTFPICLFVLSEQLVPSLNDAAADKIRKYRADYNNRSPSVVSFMPPIPNTSDRLHSEFVRLLFLQAHRETDRFFAASGVQSAQTTSGMFHLRRAVFSSGLKSKVGLVLAKGAALRININLDGGAYRI
jgi:hypothetical protein